jgi:hypothetical protein
LPGYGSNDGRIVCLLAAPEILNPRLQVRCILEKSAETVTVADFNVDGNLDIAITSGPNNRVLILLGDGRGALRPVQRGPYPTGALPMAMVTLTAMQKVDLAVNIAFNSLSRRVFVLPQEHFFHVLSKRTRNPKGQRQGRFILAVFHRDDRLPRYADFRG